MNVWPLTAEPARQDMSLDVGSEGEFVIAGTVGFPAERVRLHGDGKNPSED